MVFIQLPYFTVNFPYNPYIAHTNDHDVDLTSSITNDTLQFRYLVPLLKKLTLELINLSRPLPIDFQIFFSSIFAQGLYSSDVKEVKEHSFYELYHPATFDSLELTFIHIIVEYRSKYMFRFDNYLSLDELEYMLDWKNKFHKRHFLGKMMLCTIACNYGSPQSIQVGSIPRFIRNADHHYADQLVRGYLFFNFVNLINKIKIQIYVNDVDDEHNDDEHFV